MDLPYVKALDDMSIGGYDILAGTRVLVNVWSIAHDDVIWHASKEFHPEQFLGENKVDVMGQDFELLPLGAGRRMCPGYNLGLKVVHICLANLLLTAWHWSD